MWKCDCGRENADDFLFCATCGEPKPDAEDLENYWRCSCGCLNDSSYLYCRKCGRDRPKDIPWKCSCGMTNKGSDTYCLRCGKKKPPVSPKTLRLILIIAAAVAVAVTGIVIATRGSRKPAPSVEPEFPAADPAYPDADPAYPDVYPVYSSGWAVAYTDYLFSNPSVNIGNINVVNYDFEYTGIDQTGVFRQDYYALTDVDRDGEPELLTACGSSGENGSEDPQIGMALLLDFENGQAVPKQVMMLEGSSRLVEVSRNYLAVDSDTYDHSYSCMWFVASSPYDSEIITDVVAQCNRYNPGDGISYSIGGSDASEDWFFNCLTSGDSSVELRVPEFRETAYAGAYEMEADWSDYCRRCETVSFSDAFDRIYVLCRNGESPEFSIPEDVTPTPAPAPTPTPEPTSRPGRADLAGCKSGLVWPDSFADSYSTMYVQTTGHYSAYLRLGPGKEYEHFSEVLEATAVTVLATENGYSLCLVKQGVAGWVSCQCLVDVYTYNPAAVSPSPTPAQTFSGSDGVRTTPFYGVWGYAASVNKRDAAQAVADKFAANGYPNAAVFLTTDWSGLNKKPYYVVTSGIYSSKTEAEAALDGVTRFYAKYYPNEGTPGVKYSGDYIGNDGSTGGSGNSGSDGPSSGQPSPADLAGCPSKLVWPDKWEPYYRERYVTNDGEPANLRLGPAEKGYDVWGTVNEGTKVYVLAYQGYYCLCYVREGVAGWIHSTLLSETPPRN